MNRSKEIILVVDDESINIHLLKTILEEDYEVIGAKSGEQAFKRITNYRPDLILLDVVMPEMDGFDMCRRLKKDPEHADIPVVFVTAKRDPDDEAMGLSMGAVDYITKPFSPAIVRARVNHLLERENYKNHLEELVNQRTEELQKTKEALRIANNSKGEFLMTMSHELRTPLNGVLTASQLLAICDTQEEKDEIQDIITTSGNALLKTIEQLFDFTSSKNGELSLKSAPFCIDSALTKIRTNHFHKGKIITLDPALDIDLTNIPNAVMGDEERFIEILNHLLENAAKFTENTPKANIKLTVQDQTDDDITLKFTITDTGIGIAEKHYDKIFQPFSQVDMSTTRHYDGVGIGLSLCKQLVALMGGDLWVNSEVGKGSTFAYTIKLKRQSGDDSF